MGNNAFAHESGIHVHGVLKDPSTYEAFGPELVGMQRTIVLGKHTGAHSIKQKLTSTASSSPMSRSPGGGQGQEAGGERQGGRRCRTGGAGVPHRRAAGRSAMIKLKEFAVFTGINITPTAVVVHRHRRGDEAGGRTSASGRWMRP